MSNSNGFVMWVVLSLWCLTAYSQFNGNQQVPGLFIFGDSLVDNGNNNGILTLARANYMPYGIDFLQGTTGRFTNGRTFVDILGATTIQQLYITSLNLLSRISLINSINNAKVL